MSSQGLLLIFFLARPAYSCLDQAQVSRNDAAPSPFTCIGNLAPSHSSLFPAPWLPIPEFPIGLRLQHPYSDLGCAGWPSAPTFPGFCLLPHYPHSLLLADLCPSCLVCQEYILQPTSGIQAQLSFRRHCSACPHKRRGYNWEGPEEWEGVRKRKQINIHKAPYHNPWAQ